MNGLRHWPEILLAVAVIVSAVAVVYARHQSRQLFTELQGLIAERDALEVTWGQLRIEHGTWSNHARVEKLARERMGMVEPSPADIRLVQP